MPINYAALRAIRERSGLSVTQLSELSGVGRSHLANIEAGRRDASEQNIKALAEALKVPTVAIINGPAEAAAS